MRHKILSSYQQSLLQKEETWRGQVEERKLKGVEIEERISDTVLLSKKR